jgi:glyoxylase I family protein
MATPFSLEHIGLAARDTAALHDWYARVLGARLIFTDGKTPPAFFVELPGGVMIEIYHGSGGVPETAINGTPGWRHLALRVSSLEDARQHLEARGVTFCEPVKPAGGGGRVLFFSDPEGNLLHLVERPADSVFASRA